jgi:hypothetical protein
MPENITIYSRSDWGATDVAQDFEHNDALGVVIHNMEYANRPPESGEDAEREKAFAVSRKCQHQHMDDNKWSDTGQNFTISRGGVIMEGRKSSLDAARSGQVARGAHASGSTLHNKQFHGIELEGDYRKEYVITSEQREALINLCAHLCVWARGGPSGGELKIIPHYDVIVGHTDCPGLLIQHMDEIRDAILERIGEIEK